MMDVCLFFNVHVFCTWGKGSQGQLSPSSHCCRFLGHRRGRETLLSPRPTDIWRDSIATGIQMLLHRAHVLLEG